MEDLEKQSGKTQTKRFKENRSDPSYAPQPEVREKRGNYGKVIRRYREQAMVSQRQLSRDLGYSNSYLCNLESGICYPRLDSIVPICNYLHIPLNEFFGVESLGDGLTPAEEEVIRHFRELSPAMKSAFMTILRATGAGSVREIQYPTGMEDSLKLRESEPVVKRGRGRPRKVVDPAEAQKPKRGRGRPRKTPRPEETETN